jgi:hypothetical protein
MMISSGADTKASTKLLQSIDKNIIDYGFFASDKFLVMTAASSFVYM